MSLRLYGVVEDGLKMKRIVRIAVTTPLQRCGLGTRMPRLLENKYNGETDIIGAFSLDSIPCFSS